MPAVRLPVCRSREVKEREKGRKIAGLQEQRGERKGKRKENR